MNYSEIGNDSVFYRRQDRQDFQDLSFSFLLSWWNQENAIAFGKNANLTSLQDTELLRNIDIAYKLYVKT